MTTYRVIVPLLVLVGSALRLLAQVPAGDLGPVRTRSPLTEEDRTAVRAFIDQRVAQVVGQDPAATQAAAQALRTNYAGSDDFKKTYAAMCIEAFNAAMNQAEVAPAARLLTILNTFSVAEAQPLFSDALQDARAGVRAAAAAGLRTLRPTTAQAGAQPYASALNALKEAAKKEKSRDALRTMYAAMDYSDVPRAPDLKTDVSAVLEVLEERAKPYAARQDVPGLGADDAGLAVGEKLLKTMSPEERKRLTVVVGTMVRYAVEQFTADPQRFTTLHDATGSRLVIEQRNSLERLVLVGEKLLATLLTPKTAPGVMDAMRKLDTKAMRLQWKDWATLLQATVNQDFTLAEPAEGETGESAGGGPGVP